MKSGAAGAAKSLDIDQSNRNKSVPKILHSPNLSKRMKVQLVSNVDQSETEELDMKRQQRIIIHNKNIERRNEAHQEKQGEKDALEAKIKAVDDEIAMYTKEFNDLNPRWEDLEYSVL